MPADVRTQSRTAMALWAAGFRSTLQYRTDTFIAILMALAFQGTGFAFIWVVVSRFESVSGWTLGELAFLYGFRLIVHAVAGVLTGPVFVLETQVRSGEFDRYLLRPVSPLAQFLTQRVEISIVGDVVGGLAIFLAANQHVAVDWSATSAAYLMLAIVGGALVEGSVRILLASVTFRTLASQSLLFLSDNVFSNFGNFPLPIFGPAMQFLFTFVLPVAFVAYLPATLILDKSAGLQISSVVAFGTPLLGVVLAFVAARVFNHELAQYQSSGH